MPAPSRRPEKANIGALVCHHPASATPRLGHVIQLLARMRRIHLVEIAHLVAAEPGWKAVFKEPDGNETVSRILGWAVVSGGEDGELVGVIVDPADPSRIVPAAEAVSPGGGNFLRYRFVPAEAPRAVSTPQEAAGELAKGILKRRK